ncbi:hypothetical protein RRG08_057214 [Elysia crispata]|uniref:Uncharacterized protein n=1 Tax=Elysia crispata TaxID=231223 RepID=A0AAE1B6A2_9GAST|nr:hypothetical protein RRG08_057214 [Elysia crispata]
MLKIKSEDTQAITVGGKPLEVVKENFKHTSKQCYRPLRRDGGRNRKRSRGRPRTTWRRNLEEEMKAIGHSWRDITRMAQDRREWGTVVRGLYPLQGEWLLMIDDVQLYCLEQN